jgi:cbb3-type cytochrome oxidase subunit 3
MDFDAIVYFSKLFTTVLFSVFFTGVLIWAFRKSNKQELEGIKYAIFDEEELRRMG